MCVLLPSGETRNYINIQKERSRLRDRSIEYCNVTDLYRDQLYDAVPIPLKNQKKKALNTAEATASRNVPTKKIFPQYVENKYEDLEVHTSYKFDPAKSTYATYLWTENVGYPKELVTATA